MLTDEQLIQNVRTALERESAGIVPPPDLRARIHEELRSPPAVERRRRRARPRGLRLRLAPLATIAALLVVVAVAAVFLGVQSSKPVSPTATGSGLTIVYQAEPTAQVPVINHAAMARAVSLMRRRVAALLPGAKPSVTVTSAGAKIFVHAAGGTGISRLLSLVGTSARLEFYDWEANALTPSGQTVASLLPAQNSRALQISGQGSTAPGSPGAGSMPLYQAVALAANEPYSASSDNAQFGPEYFAFGSPGSAACTAAARHYIVPSAVGQHCYLAGPANNLSDLRSDLPPSVTLSHAQVLIVKRGTVILQAVPSSYSHAPAWSDPTAQFFVLRDHVSLFGNEITNPRQSTDQSGAPDVTFGLTSKGAVAFQKMTAQIARRGADLGGFGHPKEFQHFAVALDTQLITVPYIDYMTYPDGLRGTERVSLPGGFTTRSAQDLATQLRLGALPIHLRLIAEYPRR